MKTFESKHFLSEANQMKYKMMYSIYDLKSQKLNPKHQRRNQSLGQLYFKTVLENVLLSQNL